MKHRAIFFSGRSQYLAPHKFAPDYRNSWRGALHCCLTHFLWMENNFVHKCHKAITQNNRKRSWPNAFPLFFRWRSPTAKETHCPSPSPGPCGAARRQVRAARGSAGSRAGVAQGTSGQSSLLLMRLYSGLKCFVPKPSLIQECFLCENDVGSHPLSVWWTTTTTTKTYLRAGWPQCTMCCRKAPEELCQGITRRNKSVIADLFNKPSVTFWKLSALWDELSLATSKSPRNMFEGKSSHLVTSGLYRGGLRTQVLCTQEASVLL